MAQTVPPYVYDKEQNDNFTKTDYNFAEKQLVACETLPNPFQDEQLKDDNTISFWEARRNWIIKALEYYEIGQKPMVSRDCIDAKMVNDTLFVNVKVNGEVLTLKSHIRYPENRGTEPIPAIIGIGMPAGSLPMQIFQDRGIAMIPFDFTQVTSHTQKRGTEPINRLYPELVEIGSYAAWPWGVSRLIDGLEICAKEANIDLKHLAISGCSFAGKMALFSAALDQRIALCIAQEPGGGGVASWRVSETLGNVETLGKTNYSWFMESMRQFSDKVDMLPIDHHMLTALICPRALLILGNTDYEWLADESGYVSAQAARKVWEKYGIQDRMGFSIQGGHMHCMLPAEQFPEVEAFVDKFLLEKKDVDTNITRAPMFEHVDYMKWIPWAK